MTMGMMYDRIEWDTYGPAEEMLAGLCKYDLPTDPQELRQQRAKMVNAAMYSEGDERVAAIRILKRYGIWTQVVDILKQENLIA